MLQESTDVLIHLLYGVTNQSYIQNEMKSWYAAIYLSCIQSEMKCWRNATYLLCKQNEMKCSYGVTHLLYIQNEMEYWHDATYPLHNQNEMKCSYEVVNASSMNISLMYSFRITTKHVSILSFCSINDSALLQLLSFLLLQMKFTTLSPLYNVDKPR